LMKDWNSSSVTTPSRYFGKSMVCGASGLPAMGKGVRGAPPGVGIADEERAGEPGPLDPAVVGAGVGVGTDPVPTGADRAGRDTAAPRMAIRAGLQDARRNGFMSV
jgi:hypothetical protein